MTLVYGGDSQLWHVDGFSQNQNWISREGKSCPPLNYSVHFCDWDPLCWLSWGSVVLGSILSGLEIHVLSHKLEFQKTATGQSPARGYIYRYTYIWDSEEENAFLYLKTTSPPKSDKTSFSFAKFFPGTSLKLFVRKWVLPWYALACFSNKSGSFIVGSRTQLIM